MEVLSSEKYLIARAKKTADPYTAKAWIIAAKTLFPNDFGVQFEAYEIEKNGKNFEEAAKCLSYIIMTFQNAHQTPASLLNEISLMTAALRVPEGTTTPEQEFYVKMFQYISYEVQHKILLLTAAHSNNNLDHCRLILLLLKRFPQAISTHAPRLLETLVQNIAIPSFKEMLVQEAIPLVFNRTPELSNKLVHQIMAVCFEYYLNQMLSETEDKVRLTAENWRKIFELLDFCGKILKWEVFMPYKKSWSKDIYWQKIIHIVQAAPPRPSENKQILFCATIIFVLSLQEYIQFSHLKQKDNDIEVILMEGLKEIKLDIKRHQHENVIEIPQVIVNGLVNPDAPNCLVTAYNCWQLLHSNEILKADFTQLIFCIPALSVWIQKFLIDLSVYVGHHDETHNLLQSQNARNMTQLEKNVRLFGLALIQGNINVHFFELMNSILQNLPTTNGSYLQTVGHSLAPRVLLLMPLTKRSILHYIVQTLIILLKAKLGDPECTNSLMGNMLVLCQLNWPHESTMVEIIFEIIKSRRQFTYLLFTNYIINVDIIEEFMYIWQNCPDVKLEIALPQTTSNLAAAGSRRIGTRGADKGVKEDFKQIIRQQITRCNEDLDELIVQFLQQQHLTILQNIFEK
ncbi:integrator complex subunit 10-like [Uranotaenia lowii]|uniref:integrator complex subunit 10-like n=1 Tax=Uranotaenia lowii TaxID=190385 RepID=UPI00247B24C6|nr:integrator complex subunit 10-like [Uranotaenia lowii]XP_055613031.1 integrator complex subunit 10-like [Uranotaenia lowii]